MAGASQLGFANLHDVELCALAAAGDRRGYEELVRRHGSAVRALLRRMGAQQAESDDVAQDAFLTGFERIAEYRGEGAFPGWIKRIAARLYLRRLRKDRRLAAFAVELDDAPPAPVDADRRIDLDEALKTLSAPERLCVSLCYGAGVSHAEAAAALRLPLGTVKSHVKRGLEKLKARLASAEGAQGARRNG